MATASLLRAQLICRLLFLMLGALVLAGCGDPTDLGLAVTPTPTQGVIQAPSSSDGPKQEPPVSGEPTLEPYKFTDGRGLPFPIPSTEANPIVRASMEEAWGTNLEIRELSAAVDSEHILLLRGVSADGSSIVGLVVPRQTGSEENAQLVVLDVSTREMVQIGEIPRIYGGNYVYGPNIAMDEEWVAWVEGKIIRLYNVETRQSSQVEMATNGVEQFFMMTSAPRISGDKGVVVWAEGSGGRTPDGKVDSVIKSAEIDTGRITTIGENGVSPVISWPTVLWVEPDFTTEVEGIIDSRIVMLDLATGAKSDLGTYNWVVNIAVEGDSMVLSYGSWVTIQDLAQTRRQIMVPEGSRGYASSYTLNDRLVTWAQEGLLMAWDRKLERLVIDLKGDSARPSMGRVINGRTLAWQGSPRDEQGVDYSTLPQDSTIYLMDTAQLSK